VIRCPAGGDEAGAPTWFELPTRAYRESVDFYRSVFGWSTGGSIVQPATDTPYGRLAQVADPTGTVFRLIAHG